MSFALGHREQARLLRKPTFLVILLAVCDVLPAILSHLSIPRPPSPPPRNAHNSSFINCLPNSPDLIIVFSFSSCSDSKIHDTQYQNTQYWLVTQGTECLLCSLSSGGEFYGPCRVGLELPTHPRKPEELTERCLSPISTQEIGSRKFKYSNILKNSARTEYWCSWRQKDQKFKVIASYILSLWLAWVHEILSHICTHTYLQAHIYSATLF